MPFNGTCGELSFCVFFFFLDFSLAEVKMITVNGLHTYSRPNNDLGRMGYRGRTAGNAECSGEHGGRHGKTVDLDFEGKESKP